MAYVSQGFDRVLVVETRWGAVNLLFGDVEIS